MDLLRLFFSYFGRVNRAKFWIGVGTVYANLALATVSAVAVDGWVSTAAALWLILWVVSLNAIVVKRLHDIGHSGLWVLVFWVVLTATGAVRFWLVLNATSTVLYPILQMAESIAIFVALIWLGSAKGIAGSMNREDEKLRDVFN
jgi:uncharacterized membrane protein YhaH (DUF805 family)